MQSSTHSFLGEVSSPSPPPPPHNLPGSSTWGFQDIYWIKQLCLMTANCCKKLNIFLFFNYMIYSLTWSYHRVYLISPHVEKRTSSRTAICYTRNYLLSRRDHHVSFSRYKFVEIVRGKSLQLLWIISNIVVVHPPTSQPMKKPSLHDSPATGS